MDKETALSENFQEAFVHCKGSRMAGQPVTGEAFVYPPEWGKVTNFYIYMLYIDIYNFCILYIYYICRHLR